MPQDEEHTLKRNCLLSVPFYLLSVLCLLVSHWTLTCCSEINAYMTCIGLCYMFSAIMLYKAVHNNYVNNIVIIASAVILYVTVILVSMDGNTASDSTVSDHGLSHERIWLSVIEFSLMYGTMFAKVWKIYHTVKHSKLDPDDVKVCKHKYCL